MFSAHLALQGAAKYCSDYRRGRARQHAALRPLRQQLQQLRVQPALVHKSFYGNLFIVEIYIGFIYHIGYKSHVKVTILYINSPVLSD